VKVIQFINTIFDSNSYIIYSDEYELCWLVDCGDAQPLLDWIYSNNKTLAGIFITHTHTDHIYGLNDVVASFPECIIYVSNKGKEGLYSETLNLSAYHDKGNFVYKYENVITIKEGDSIPLYKDVCVKAMETPGHDWSCLCYSIDEVFFTGDSFIPNKRVVTTFPKSNKQLAMQSIDRIINTFKDATIIYPGHGISEGLRNCINL
jgi:hydroxyacylglutathione hydrolase